MNETNTIPAPVSSAPPLRNFWMMFVVECQNALSDNLLKFLVIFMVVNSSLTQSQKEILTPVVTVLFSLPFILFSMTGGYFADRFSKRNVTSVIKCAEIGIMSLALLGFWLHNLPILLGCIFLMSTHSAIFGPSKYGMLPELLPEKKLSWGNGVFSLGTFGAIIAGSVIAGGLSDHFKTNQAGSGFILIGLAAIGLCLSTGVIRLAAADPKKQFRANFIGDFWTQLKGIHQDRVLYLGVVGNAYLWALGALLQMVIIFYAKDVLLVDDTHNGYLQAALAIGLGVGSFAAGCMSRQKIQLALVAAGHDGFDRLSRLVGVASFVVWARGRPARFTWIFWRPLQRSAQCHHSATARFQHERRRDRHGGARLLDRDPARLRTLFSAHEPASFEPVADVHCRRGVVTSRNNLLCPAAARFVAAVCAALRDQDRLSRARDGRAHVPERGGAMLICNHVSLMDALFVMAATDRPVRFLLLKSIYEKPSVHWGARLLGVIPVSSEQHPREMIKSLQGAAAAIENGELVCIFAEGQITRTGQLQPFRRGFERIMKNVTAPIIPVGLNGVWGSIFSFENGRFFWKWPRLQSRHVSVNFGRPMAHDATHVQVRQAVQELLTETWNYRLAQQLPLHRAFIRTARRHPRRFAMADGQTKKVTFGNALVKSIFLAHRLRPHWQGQKMVGIFLPPTVAGALVNQAALLCGKIPVNLNYTLSEAALASCAQQCAIETVVTSRLFLEKIKLTPPGKIIFLEDLAKDPTIAEKLNAWLQAKMLPAPDLEKLLADKSVAGGNPVSVNDLATIIFSSGSTGEPKGVMLSHANITANVEQLEQVFSLNEHDKILGILPFFHSFGFTATLALPAVLGVGAVFHPNPLDSKSIGVLVREHAVTFLLATPTFLQIYLRGCAAEDFGSLRLVMTGAEKLPDRLAVAFEDHFGIRPLEGYGCTECSPAVSVNTFDYRAAGFRQVGAKRGTIGHPLPGVSVRIVPVDNPQSETTLPIGEAGLLLVRGPNVMQGYLNRPEKTAEVLRDGWYCTGDVATLDEDGFLKITDRLNRFSKIGGEMVPHIKIEEKLHELSGNTEQTFVVTGVPDEKKGERLVVLHKLKPEALAACLEKLAASDLPNLWKPKTDSFFAVDAFPLLGTGKLDLRQVKEKAVELTKAG